MESMAKILLGIGALVAVTGLILFGLAKLGVTGFPGDLTFRRGGLTVWVPIGTSIVLSILLTVLLNVFFRR